MRRPLFSLFLAFVSGLILARGFHPHPVWVILLAFGVVAVFILTFRKGRIENEIRLWPLAIMLALALGMLRFQWGEADNLEKAHHVFRVARYGEIQLEGTVRSPIEIRSKRYRFIASECYTLYEGRRYPFPIRCLVEGKADNAPRVEYGDQVLLQGYLIPVRAASLPGGFDYQEYLASQNIHGRFWVKQPVNVLGHRRLSIRDRFLRASAFIRQKTLDRFKQALPQTSASLMGALLLGERSDLPEELYRNLVTSGLMHVTAVSGLHVSFVVFLFAGFLKIIGLRRKVIAPLVAVFILFFLAMVGFRIPSIRAVLMGYAVVLTYLCERDVDSLSSIAAAGLLILFLSPLSAFQAGFQMSFVTVGALVLFVPRWDQWVREKHLPWQWFWTSMGVAVIAQIAISPILIYNFSIWSPVGVLANLIAIPLVGILIGLGMVYMAASMVFSASVAILGPLLSLLLFFLEKIICFFGSIPGGHFYASPMSPLSLGCWYAAFLVLAAHPIEVRIGGKSRSLRKSVIILALIGIWLWGGIFWPQPGKLQIDFLSLGQGDCIFLKFPGGGNLLVDGGQRFEPGARLSPLEQYLRKQGIHEISAIVNTHPESDHIGNLPEVIEKYNVGAVFVPGVAGEGEDYVAFHQAILESGCRCQSVRRGQQLYGFPGVTIEILGPNPDYLDYQQLDINEHSVILRIEYGEFSCLLTGDIGWEIEQELVRQHLLEPSWVLKVPHHGSKNSSSRIFLEQTRPEIAVIQVGRNYYGHPSQEAIDRLRDMGSLVFRTDRDGTIRLTSDGKSYQVRTFQGGRAYLRPEG